MRAFALILVLLIMLMGRSASGQGFSTDAIKAAFIYNIQKFIYWNEENIMICILHNDGDSSAIAIKGFLQEIVSKRYKNIEIKEVEIVQKECNVLFISDKHEDDIEDILVLSKRSQILTISDIRGFSLRGGGFELEKLDDGKIRTIMNKKNTDYLGIKVSAELLDMIKVVE